MITMGKSTHGFPFLSFMSMGPRLAALRAAGAPLLSSQWPVLVHDKDFGMELKMINAHRTFKVHVLYYSYYLRRLT